jgi:DNA-binding MarR family transcriptional regulator
MKKLEFLLSYNRSLLRLSLLHRDAVVLAAVACLQGEGQAEVITSQVVDACDEQNAANILRRLASQDLLAYRHDTRRIDGTTHRVVYYSLTPKGLSKLGKILESE